MPADNRDIAPLLKQGFGFLFDDGAVFHGVHLQNSHAVQMAAAFLDMPAEALPVGLLLHRAVEGGAAFLYIDVVGRWEAVRLAVAIDHPLVSAKEDKLRLSALFFHAGVGC